ncbi:hypothetical protein Cadr_000031167, partial [Camelus dromedarius]
MKSVDRELWTLKGRWTMNGCELVESSSCWHKGRQMAEEDDDGTSHSARRPKTARSQELEREISELRSENSDLRRVNSDLRRENSSELRREVAHLKQRLDAICRRRRAEEYMRQEPTQEDIPAATLPLRASGPGGAPVRNGTAFPAQEAEETQ